MGDVRSANSAAVRNLCDLLPGDGNAKRAKPRHHALSALAPGLADLGTFGRKAGIGGIEEVAEQVDTAGIHKAG